MMKEAVIFLIFHLFVFIPIKSFGDNQAQDYYQTGKKFFQEENWQEAESQFSQAIQSDPDYVIAYIARGSVRVRLKNYEEALADLDFVIGIDSSYPEAFSSRGSAWIAMGDFEKAKADFDTALQLDPQFYRALYNRGNAYFKLKQDYYSALKDYNQVLALNPHHEGAWKKMEITKEKISQMEAGKLNQLKKQAEIFLLLESPTKVILGYCLKFFQRKKELVKSPSDL